MSAASAGRRALGVAAAVVVAAVAVAGLLAALTSRDRPGVRSAPGPGEAFPDLGAHHLAPGAPRPRYASDPPTSGAHVAEPIARDDAPLSDDALLHALELGDVVLLHPPGRAAPALRRVALEVARAPFSPALAAAGQAVILAPRRDGGEIVAVAWRHLLRVAQAEDPRLADFVAFWLGRGAR